MSKKDKSTNAEHWNEMRLMAAEIIRKLYEANERRQLELLEIQVRRSLEEINKPTP